MSRSVAVARAVDGQLGYDLLLVGIPVALLAGKAVAHLTGSPLARVLGVVAAAALVLDALFVHAPSVDPPRRAAGSLADVPTGRLEKVRRVDRPATPPLEAVRRGVSPSRSAP